MDIWHTLLLVAHVLVGALIVGLVLLQRGKGAEVGAAFGSGASGTVFGAKGSANFLSRFTAILAICFFGTSLLLTYFGSQRPVTKSVVDSVAPEAPAGPAAVPGTTQPLPDAPAAPGDAARPPAPPQGPTGAGNPAP